jgi:transposase
MINIIDLPDIVLEMLDQFNRQQKRISFLEDENRDLRWKNHQLELENRRLTEEIIKSGSPKKSSRNSSIPPSQESPGDQHIRRTQSLRVSSGLKPGGQLGHPGHSLSIPAHVDREAIHSVSICPDCGGDLSQCDEETVEERFEIDLPKISKEVIRHKLMRRSCPCGCQATGSFPSHLQGKLSYGRCIEATVGYLNTVHHLPFKRTVDLMKSLFEVSLSEGTVHRMLQSLQSSAEKDYDCLRREVCSSPVVGADETGLNIGGKLHWLWTFQTDKATYVFPHESRGKAAVDDHFPEGLPNSWLVTDRHSSYFNLFVKGHQICLPHVLRNLQYLSELDARQSWSERLKKLLQEAIHKRKTLPWHRIDRVRMMNRFNALLGEDLSVFHKEVLSLQTGLGKHREHVLAFLFEQCLPSDNNASERSIRPLKVKQKVSGCFRTELGARTYAVLHSITDTERKNGRSPWKKLWELASG